MGLYGKYLLPRLTHHVCGQKPAMKQREKIVSLAEGDVLEIGIGSGLNLPFYDRGRVRRLWGLDPSREMWALAGGRGRAGAPEVEFIEASAEDVPLDDACADTVLITYTLCSIPDTAAALAQVRRVLKPGGRLLFCEHGEAPDEDVRRWQRRLGPLWTPLAGGCHLGRPIPRLLDAAGFRCDDLQSMYIPGWRPGCYNYWGTARPR